MRSGLLARDKRKAPCGHWIVDYEKTARLKRAEAAVRKMRSSIWNRQGDAVHNVTARVIRTYGRVTVDARPGHDAVAAELMRQLDYKGAWHGRKVTRCGTAA